MVGGGGGGEWGEGERYVGGRESCGGSRGGRCIG